MFVDTTVLMVGIAAVLDMAEWHVIAVGAAGNGYRA